MLARGHISGRKAPPIYRTGGGGTRRGTIVGSGGGRNALPAYEAPEEPVSPLVELVESVSLVVDLDPQNLAAGASFVAWQDGSLFENHFLASGSLRPTVIPNWLDGQQAAQFDGIGNRMWRNQFRGLVAESKPCVLFVIDADDTQPEPAPTVFYMQGADPTYRSPFAVEHTASQAKVYTRLGPSATDTRASGLTGTTAPHWVLAVLSNDDDKPEVWVDGERKGVAPSGVAGGMFDTVLQVTIGGGTSVGSDPLNRWCKGMIGGFVMFDGMPLSSEWDAIFPVLAARWPSLPWEFA